MLKQEKERVVAELVARLQASETLLVADYRGLDMIEIDAVRTELIKHGARFTVVKNTLTKRAAEQAGVEELNQFLDGPTAIAFVGDGDMVAVAKALNDSAKQTKILALKGGILAGKPITADDVRELASLPPMEQLRGQVLAAIIAPLNAIAGLVNAPLQNLLGLVAARIEQLREEGDDSEVPAEAPADEAEPEAPSAEEEPAPEASADADTADTTEATEETNGNEEE